MIDKKELLEKLGFSEELLKYFQQPPLETHIAEHDFDFISFGSQDLTNIPNFDQLELAGTTFTYASKE